MRYKYTINRIEHPIALDSGWNGEEWRCVKVLEINNFINSPELKDSDHRPITLVKSVYDDNGLYVLFKSSDRYVRCVNTGFQSNTCEDSCVELFLRPKPWAGIEHGGYFNFEINCGGALKCRYTTMSIDGVRIFSLKIDREDLNSFNIYHSLPEIVEPEIDAPTTWYIGLYTPFKFYERYVGAFEKMAGRNWHGNFYKCGNKTSHPHYGSWTLLNQPTFHLPNCFGELNFAP